MTAATTAPAPRGLARGLGRDFNLLWLGQSVSNVGDRINLFVVPTVMILLLHASAFQVGLVADGGAVGSGQRRGQQRQDSCHQ